MNIISNHLIVAITVFAFLPLMAAATEKDEGPKLSSSAARAIDAYERGLARLKAEFDKDVAREKARLAPALDAEMKRVLRSGDLEGAQAVKDMQTKLEQRTGLEETDMLGNPILKDTSGSSSIDIVGKTIRMNFPGNSFDYWSICSEGGKGVFARKGASWTTTWSMEDGVLSINADHGYSMKISVDQLSDDQEKKGAGTLIHPGGKTEEMSSLWVEAKGEK